MDYTSEEKRFIELAREKRLALNSTAAYIIEVVQAFNPYEEITITKDKGGVPNQYLVHRSQKLLVNEVVLAKKVAL